MKKLFLLLLLLTCGSYVYAQGVSVFGTVRSAQDQTGLPGAHVVLTRTLDSAVTASVTDAEGKFRFERVRPGAYRMEVKYLGFANFSRAIQVENRNLDLGPLNLAQDQNTLQEVQIIGRVPLGEQKSDTTQYNAGAFKTAPDASAEDLVQKMPGITIENGRIQAQGEDVARILIDGKRYFGDDADAALRNLPADVIESIQVFDKQSDRAEMTGFDDGNREKTINIVTKPDKRVGQFGKASAGYGTDDRYMVGAAVNFFDNDRLLTVTGLTNNINLFDFSVGETPGGGMRGRRGGRGGSPTGITTTNTLGLNYSDMWGSKMEVSGSYSFNRRENEFTQNRFQDFIPAPDAPDSGQVYTENSYNATTEANHRMNFRLDYKMNENNRLLIIPRITAQQQRGISSFQGRTVNDFFPLNQTINDSNWDNSNFNLENDIHYSHQFGKKGRSFSTSLSTGYSTNKGDSYRTAENLDYVNPDRNSFLNQYARLNQTGFSWEGEISYTEPVGQFGQVEVEYEVGNSVNDSDRRTFNYAEQTNTFSLMDTLLTNTFKSDYLRQGVETGYQFRKENIRLQVELEYQHARLQNDQVFPEPLDMNRTFTNVLPSARFEYEFSETKNLNIDYRARTNAPSVGQLQNVIDYSNTLRVRTGNPELDQTFDNRFRVRYRAFNPESNKTFFAGLFGNMTQNYIGNSTEILTEPLQLSEEISVPRGAQLIRPVNLNGYWSVRSFFSYGQPLPFIESNLNVRGFMGYTRLPGLRPEGLNFSNSRNVGVGLTLSSNISERVDFNVSSNSRYNIVNNTLNPDQFNNTFNQNTSLRLNWILWKGLVYRTELNHQLNSGLSEGFNTNFVLWNMSLGKKLFKNQQGEISLSVNDLLKQNVSVQRNVTDIAIEDVQTSVLQRFFMLTFTYNIRNYSGELPDFDQGGDQGNYRGGGGGGRR